MYFPGTRVSLSLYEFGGASVISTCILEISLFNDQKTGR
jgi:hypothetical protein